MSKDIYDELFNFYCIRRNRDNIRNIRRTIRERLKKEYPSKTWDELDDYQKHKFKVYVMKDYLLEQSGNRDKANKNLKEAYNELFEAYEVVGEHNKTYETLHKQYFNESDSDEIQKASYKEYCYELRNMFPDEQIPSFDEWKKHPLRLYDIQQEKLHDELKAYQNKNYNNTKQVPQDKIDHVVLECVVKVIEDKLKTEINIDDITHCLEASFYTDIIESNKQSITKPALSSEKENPINDTMLKSYDIIESIKRLNKLDFISPAEDKKQK